MNRVNNNINEYNSLLLYRNLNNNIIVLDIDKISLPNFEIKNLLDNLNSTLKCNSMTGCERSGAAVGFALFSQSNKRCTYETLQPAHAGKKIRNIYIA